MLKGAKPTKPVRKSKTAYRFLIIHLATEMFLCGCHDTSSEPDNKHQVKVAMELETIRDGFF